MSESLRPHGLQQCQASLSITNSQSLLKLMSIESVMPSSRLILCQPLLLYRCLPFGLECWHVIDGLLFGELIWDLHVSYKSIWLGYVTFSLSQWRANQSILKEINPQYSLEGLMLKLKLQYFGHLMQRANLLEKILMLGRLKGIGE